MPYLNNSCDVQIHYTDYGKGKPVILIHGWPLSGKSWEYQVPAIVEEGFRCITYDRKGFGKSEASWDRYDYSNLASDLNDLIKHLNLEECTLVGFSMGGGEVIRYLREYGSNRIEKIILVSSIIPLVKQKPDNPDGVPEKDLDAILDALQDDRAAFLPDFFAAFYNGSASKQQMDYDFAIASAASPRATIACAEAWMETDFREECTKIDIPTLIIHGKKDATVPIETSAYQAEKLIPNSKLIVYDDAPHGLNITHKEKLNNDLIHFLHS